MKTYLWRVRPLMWLEDELHAMCKQGLVGVIAAGCIVTMMLLIPVWTLQVGLLHYWPPELLGIKALWKMIRG